MTQYAFDLAPTNSGDDLVAALDSWRDAIQTSHKGGTQPTYRVAGMFWLDDSGGVTSTILKQYDGIDWISVLTFNYTANTVTFAGAVSASQFTGREEDWIDASAGYPALTNGAQAGIRTLATNLQPVFYLAFDATVAEIVWFRWVPRKRYNGGTITFQPHWTAESGSGTASWQLAGVASSNDDTLDAAVGGAVSSDDTLLAANDLHISPESTAITIGGTFTDGDHVWLRLARNVSDTIAVDTQLIGIKIFYTSDQGNDA